MSGGVATALGEAIEAVKPAEEVVEGDLFGADLVGDNASASPLSAAFAPRGPGRRPGSRNKRTEAVSAWLLSQGRHPVLVMMEAYALTPAELAERIGIEEPDGDQLLELFKLQLRMAEAVAPYVAQKLPQAVDLTSAAGGDFQLTFLGVSLPARGGAAEETGGPVIDHATLRLPAKSDG